MPNFLAPTFAALCLLTGLSGCSRNTMSNTGTPTVDGFVPSDHSFVIGGTVAGLKGTGLVLQDNGGDDLSVGANGSFAFHTLIDAKGSYAVTIAHQPTVPSQTCAVTQGSGLANATVKSVAITCNDNGYLVGGTVSGLVGGGLVLQNNGGGDLGIAANGSFTFAMPVASGQTFTVTLETQPTSPTQTCVVSGGSGTVGAGDVGSVAVNCSTNSYTVGGSVTGLAGTGLVLRDSGGDDLALTANGSFAFATPVKSGGAYAVTVASQPTAPAQICSVASGGGTVAHGNVTSVTVTCSTSRFIVGGSVAGLAGSGLVLQDNLGDNLPVSANGAFSFVTPVASGAAYAVTVLAQPGSLSQTCTVASGSGTVGGAAIGDVTVTCATNSYTIGGSVSGLGGGGLVLQDNSGDDLAVTASGNFTFATAVTSGQDYAVTIKTQPSSPTQTCSVSGAGGTVGGAAVTTVVVNCSTNTYTIGGSVTGLAGSGLGLKLNGGTTLFVTAAGSFAFPTALASGASYTVTLAAQPAAPSQTCTLGGAAGNVVATNITSVTVSCTTNHYSVGGTVTGLAGSGLVLEDNAGDDLSVATAGSFTFATQVASGQPYLVTVATQPSSPSQTCTVTSGGGNVGAGAVSSVAVSCVTNVYTIGGTISGLAGTIVLADNVDDPLTLNANGSFHFGTKLASGSAYNVTVTTQPGSPSQSCTVVNDSGPVVSADVTGVVVTCVTNHFNVGGTLTGLLGASISLQDNGGDTLTLTADGSFTFATKVPSGQPYAVTVSVQPSGPSQQCTVSGDSGTVGGSAVTSVSVNCVTNSYNVGGTVSGLGSAGGLVLQNNLGDDLSVTADGSFAFATPVASGAGYAVTVKTQPTSPWKTCSVANDSGPVISAAITSVAVTCVANPYDLAVSVTGLAGSGLVLQNNFGDNLSVASGSATFATQVNSGDSYSVTVLTQPTSLSQNCVVTAPTGVMPGGTVTLGVTCTTNSYMVMGTLSGIGSNSVTLQDNGGDDLVLTTDGQFMFDTNVASGSAYAVTVSSQPAFPSLCTVTSGSGTIGATDVLDVTVTCKSTILFVDDDNGLNGQGTWLAAVTAAGYNYDYEALATNGNPVTDLSGYRLVIWSNGDTAYDNLTAQNVATLTAYLNLGGGRGLLYGGGHSVYSETQAGSFIDNYLGIANYNSDMPMLSNSSLPASTNSLAAPLSGTAYTWVYWPTGTYRNMLSAFSPSASTAYGLLAAGSTNTTGLTGSNDIIVMNATPTYKAMTWGIDLNQIGAAGQNDLLAKCLSLF
jgi:hypothetical protein